MGRGYVADEGVDRYLSHLCVGGAAPVSGLLIGQSSVQRDFVVMATQTPRREGSVAACSLDQVDMEWFTEHAQQLSRMLPGGLSIIGVFLITSTEAKDTLNTMRQLVFAVEDVVSKACWCNPADDDITERVTLHISTQTRKSVCRTFDVSDPRSTAKPADWKSQPGGGVAWGMLGCSVMVDLLVPLPGNQTSLEDTKKQLEVCLRGWAGRVDAAVCLIDGRRWPDDAELSAGQKKNMKYSYRAQLLVQPAVGDVSPTGSVQVCAGSVFVQGTVHARAYVHPRTRALQAERLLKRDAVCTVAGRLQILLEDLLTNEEETKLNSTTECWPLPLRVFCRVLGAGPLSVCDYQFADEGKSQVMERLKETLDMEPAEQDLDCTLESPTEAAEDIELEKEEAVCKEAAGDSSKECQTVSYTGVAMATAVTLLATAASMIYLNDY